MAVISIVSPDVTQRRRKFFEFLFDRTEGGFVCFARRKPRGAFEERFYRWPNEVEIALDYVAKSLLEYNIWFCPMLFSRPNRSKYDVSVCPAVWSDLDSCPPDSLLVPPTLLLETSNGRHQGLWCTDELLQPLEAEEVSKSIAYRHADEGADKSGWDLTQLLRVPFTLNFKYDPAPVVMLVNATEVVTLDRMLEAYPVLQEDRDAEFPFPEHIPDVEQLMRAYRDTLDSKVWMLLRVPPEKDWSKALWSLEMRLAESGLSREDMFSLARSAACNKYVRDNRNERLLWKEVCRAWIKHRERSSIIQDATAFKDPELLSDEDLKVVAEDRTFIDDYIDWAKTVGDAAEAYHHAGAFICLSALMSGSVQLPTSFGTIVPNLWFLLLADTTLTRKSTALDLAIDLLMEVEPDAIMATDGSIEGLFSGLSLRPGKPSIFLRDEFSGLIEMMAKRDYYAGMAETLTKMYDGKFQKRILRRETIEVKEPILLIFAGGIRTKILNLLTTEQVTSGFLPRFIFISAQSDITRLKPLGPPEEIITTGRTHIRHRMELYKEAYKRETTIKVAGTDIATKNIRKVQLTPPAWHLYNEMERKLLETGINNRSNELLTPVMDRLAKSGLKAAVLIAASRLREKAIVDEADILKAFSYVTVWRTHAMDVVSSVGLPAQERLTNNVHNTIIKHPGISRARLMLQYHLTARDADIVLSTLEQRGQIDRVRQGRTEAIHPVED